MKRRVRKIANFFAFNLLFFALYLNFIHKDKRPMAAIDTTEQAQQQTTPAFGGTVLVDNPQAFLQKSDAGNSVKPAAVVSKDAEEKSATALKLSIN